MGDLEAMAVDVAVVPYHMDVQTLKGNDVGWNLLLFIFIDKQTMVSQYVVPGLHDSSLGPDFQKLSFLDYYGVLGNNAVYRFYLTGYCST